MKSYTISGMSIETDESIDEVVGGFTFSANVMKTITSDKRNVLTTGVFIKDLGSGILLLTPIIADVFKQFTILNTIISEVGEIQLQLVPVKHSVSIPKGVPIARATWIPTYKQPEVVEPLEAVVPVKKETKAK
jgi:hypothetical protein